MNTIENLQLSAELQELYLENKERISQLNFLKDEHRFFDKLFANELDRAIKRTPKEVLAIGKSLGVLKIKIEKLEALTLKHGKLIETILKDKDQHVGLELLEQNAAIGQEINLLLDADRDIKKHLFTMVEQ